MVVQHPHRQSFPARAIRLAAQIVLIEAAVVAATLALWGFLRPSDASFAPRAGLVAVAAAAPETCAHFGRAGGHCPDGAREGGPDAARPCDFLGRAGRACPPLHDKS